MNKSQIILAAIGGMVVVGALVLGYFIWDASSVKAERAETLDDNAAAVKTAAHGLSVIPKDLPVKTNQFGYVFDWSEAYRNVWKLKKEAWLENYRTNCPELAIYWENAAAYRTWTEDARKIASRGDLVFDKVTPAEFKTAIVGEARKFADMPGCFNGKFVKPDFGFGFKEYVTGGALPPDKDLKRLQREWNDVTSVLKTIAECGGADSGIVDVRMGASKVKVEGEGEEDAKPKKKGKRAKKAKVKVEDEGEEGAADGPAITSFTVEFMTRPSGLVKAVNAFATGTRFVVVEDFTFAREKDEIAEALGGDSKKTEQASSNRRRRRQQAQETQKEETKGGMVTDPAAAPLMKVSMAISVYDFRSLEEDVKAKDEGEEKEDEK